MNRSLFALSVGALSLVVNTHGAQAQDALTTVTSCGVAGDYLNDPNWVIAPTDPDVDIGGWHRVYEPGSSRANLEAGALLERLGVQLELNEFTFNEFHLVNVETWEQVTISVFQQYGSGPNGSSMFQFCFADAGPMEEGGLL
jgi:hypothetical protein